MHTRTVCIPVLIACLSIFYYFPICLSISALGALTLFGCIIGALMVVWVHILLSSQHKTGLGEEPIHKELEHFRNKLMVLKFHILICCFNYILYLLNFYFYTEAFYYLNILF